MFDRWQKAVDEPDDLNVIPVMNLFMVLIPFLLMGAAFYHIGVIPVSTPTHDPQESDVPTTPTTVTANLTIKADLMRVTLASTSLTETELEELAGEWPAKNGAYNIHALQAYLVDLKAKYPKSNTIIVVPFDELDYQTLVRILDKTREVETGTNADGDPIKEELFPVTVFSRFIPPPPPGSEEEFDLDGEEELGEEELGEEEPGDAPAEGGGQ